MRFIDRISVNFPVGAAAGWCKSVAEVERLAESAAQFIIFGSITLEPRGGNPGNTFNGVSLNSLGLPNPGIKQVMEWAPDLIRIAHEAGKPIILSVAGFAPDEYPKISKVAQSLCFDGVELNLGCPNVADGGKRKPISSLDLRSTDEIVSLSTEALNMGHCDFFVSVKVSPMSNPLQIIETAELLATKHINAVVTQNTFPNALLFNADGSPQIQTPDKTGWAGLAGKGIKPIALGQVNQWRKALDACGALHILVSGVGGVENGLDVRDMLTAGATYVRVGTAYFVGGAKAFGDIANEFINL